MDVPETIYQMILDDLHITFTPDDATARRLKDRIKDGIAYIKANCDPVPDCEPGGKHAALLKDYVLRAESGAVSTFPQDFAGEIRSSRVAFDVEGYAEAMGYAES